MSDWEDIFANSVPRLKQYSDKQYSDKDRANCQRTGFFQNNVLTISAKFLIRLIIPVQVVCCSTFRAAY